MLFAVIIGMFINGWIYFQKIKVWVKLFTEKEEGFCGKMVGLPTYFRYAICWHDRPKI